MLRRIFLLGTNPYPIPLSTLLRSMIFPSQPLGNLKLRLSQSPAMFFHSDGRDQHKVATDRLGKVPRGSKGGIPSPSPSLRMLQIEGDAFCEIHFHSREQIPGWDF